MHDHDNMSSLDTVLSVVTFTCISINFLVGLPLLVYVIVQYRKHRHLQIFKSRSRIPLNFVLISTLIIFTLERSYVLLDNMKHRDWMHLSVPYSFIQSLDNSSVIFLLLLWLWKTYCIYYDFNYAQACLELEWRSFSSSTRGEKVWFIRHRKNIGNKYFSGVIIGLIWFVTTAIITTIHSFLNSTNQISVSMLIGIAVLALHCYLMLKMPGVDVFRIKEELKFQIGGAFLWFITLLILILILPRKSGHTADGKFRIACVLYYELSAIAGVALAAHEVLFPVHVHNQEIAKIKAKSIPTSPKLRHGSSISEDEVVDEQSEMESGGGVIGNLFRRVTSFTHEDKPATQAEVMAKVAASHLSLEVILASHTGLEIFLRHLAQEVSVENLFYLSDVIQFKHSLINDGYVATLEGWNMKLTNSVPLSRILKLESPYERARAINDMYIRESGDRCVNISYQARKEILNKFDSLDINDPPSPENFILRFDKAAVEIRNLLKDSYQRFCLTPEYSKFVENYNSRFRKMGRRFSRSLKTMSRDTSRSDFIRDDNIRERSAPPDLTSHSRVSKTHTLPRVNATATYLSPRFEGTTHSPVSAPDHNSKFEESIHMDWGRTYTPPRALGTPHQIEFVSLAGGSPRRRQRSVLDIMRDARVSEVANKHMIQNSGDNLGDNLEIMIAMANSQSERNFSKPEQSNSGGGGGRSSALMTGVAPRNLPIARNDNIMRILDGTYERRYNERQRTAKQEQQQQPPSRKRTRSVPERVRKNTGDTITRSSQDTDTGTRKGRGGSDQSMRSLGGGGSGNPTPHSTPGHGPVHLLDVSVEPHLDRAITPPPPVIDQYADFDVSTPQPTDYHP